MHATLDNISTQKRALYESFDEQAQDYCTKKSFKKMNIYLAEV